MHPTVYSKYYLHNKMATLIPGSLVEEKKREPGIEVDKMEINTVRPVNIERQISSELQGQLVGGEE